MVGAAEGRSGVVGLGVGQGEMLGDEKKDSG